MPVRPNRRRFVLCVEGVEARVLLSATPVDTRVEVPDTKAYPYSAIVRLWVQMPRGEAFAVSGAMIDSTHVLTAAHNIYNKNDGGWARSVTVYPGQSGETIPLGTYRAVRETIYTDYAIHETHAGENFGFDVALLRLNTPVVPAVGALGQAIEPDAFFQGRSLVTSGYPGDLPRGSDLAGAVMYAAPGHSTGASSHIVHFNNPIAGGQSGSPLYWTTTTGTYIVGVVSFGAPAEDDPAFHNGAVRLTPIVSADLMTWSIVDSVTDTSIFKHAALPHDPTTFVVTTAFTPQARMHVLPG